MALPTLPDDVFTNEVNLYGNLTEMDEGSVFRDRDAMSIFGSRTEMNEGSIFRDGEMEQNDGFSEHRSGLNWRESQIERRLSLGSGMWIRGIYVTQALANSTEGLYQEGGEEVVDDDEWDETEGGDQTGCGDETGHGGEIAHEGENGHGDERNDGDVEGAAVHDREYIGDDAAAQGSEDAVTVAADNAAAIVHEPAQEHNSPTRGCCGQAMPQANLNKPFNHTMYLFLYYGHFLVLLSMLVVLCLLVLLLISCTSSTTGEFYLLSLVENTISNSTTQSSTSPSILPLVVRVGYFSLCVSQSDYPWLCSSDTGSLIKDFGNGTSSPASIFGLALRYQNNLISSGMIVASITCILIAGVMAKRPAFVNLRTSHNNIQYMINSNGFWDDNRNVFAVMGLGLSTLFTMLAVIWQQVTAKGVVAMAESMEGTHPSASAGVSSMALGLGAFGLAAATTFVMSIGIKLMQGRRPAGQNVEMASGYTCPVHGITGV